MGGLVRFLFLTALLFTSVACLRNTDSLPAVEKMVVLNNTVFTPDSLPNDDLVINSAEVDYDGNLTVSVSHSGGCKDHEYGLYWSAELADTDPPTILFYLTHDSHNDACEAWLTKTVTLDISSVLGWAMDTSGEVTFRLAFHYPPDWERYETTLFWTAPD